jgi:hypothetical protein
MGDGTLVERLVRDDPSCLSRRRARVENCPTPVLATFAPPDGLGVTPNYAMLERLLALGADADATDDKGRTPLAVAMLRGDRVAMRLLLAAGAKPPTSSAADAGPVQPDSVRRFFVALYSPDMGRTLDWYTAIGFEVAGRHEVEGAIDHLVLTFGAAGVHFSRHGTPLQGASLWLYTDAIDSLYQRFRAMQLNAMQAVEGSGREVRFSEDLYTPFYGGRQFSIDDPHGVTLVFYEPPRS